MEKKILIPKAGDIVKLKPIALLIAEKKITLVNSKAEDFEIAYRPRPLIVAKMMPNFRGTRKLTVRRLCGDSFSGVSAEGDSWNYKCEWIQSIEKKK